MKTRRLALALAVLLWLSGCAAVPPAAPPAAAPVSGAEALSRLHARQQGLKSFLAKGSLTYLSPEKNYSGTASLAGQFPSTLKVEVFDNILGRTRLVFTTDGREVRVLSPGEGKLFFGPATPRNLGAFLPPTVSLPQALQLMAGALPLSPGEPERFEYEPGQGLYRLEWGPAGGPLQERLWLSARGLYPVKEEWFGGASEPRFTAELADFGAQAPDIPGKITLKCANPQMELRLTYREMHPNAALTATDLALPTPAGVAEVRLP